MTDDDIDIGSSGAQFKNGYFDGTLEADALTVGGTAVSTATTLGALTDVTMDKASVGSGGGNFLYSILIDPASDGAAPDLDAVTGNAYNNYGIGLDTFKALTSGSANVCIGEGTGKALTSGYSNVIIGGDSGQAMTTGYGNVCVGVGSGSALTTPNNCIAIGKSALDASDDETHNVAIGLDALGGAVAGGEYNVAIGNYSLDALTSADSNVAIGHQAGTAITTGGTNTIVGRGAGAALTTGLDSVLIGTYAGTAIIGADQNVCVGSSAGGALTSGATNTFIGQGAGDAMQTGSNNTCIGVNCDASANDVSNAISLGAAVNAAANDFSFGKASNVVTNDFDADADWSRSSDIRLKRNIQDSTLGLDFINDLRPVKFQWKPSNEVPKEMKAEYSEVNQKNLDIVSHGFIAQEVKEAIDKYGDTTFGGWHLDKTDNETQRVKKNMFVMPLIKAVQELTARVKELEAK